MADAKRRRGRPPREGGGNAHDYHIGVTKREEWIWNELARRNRTTVADMVRGLVQDEAVDEGLIHEAGFSPPGNSGEG